MYKRETRNHNDKYTIFFEFDDEADGVIPPEGTSEPDDDKQVTGE